MSVYRTEMWIDAPVDHVFDFFVDPDLLTRWLGVSARLDPRPGGTFRFEVMPGEWCSGSYVLVDRPRRVAFTWGWESGAIDVAPGTTTVEVELQRDGGGTRLTLTHHGLDGGALRLHADGWGRYLDRLDAVATGAGAGDDDPTAETPAEALRRLEGR